MKCERVAPAPVKFDYQLTLTHEEALVLKAICGNISGDPKKSYRKVTTALYRALGDDFDQSSLNYVRDRILIVTKPLSRPENHFTEDKSLLAASLECRDGFIYGSEFE